MNAMTFHITKEVWTTVRPNEEDLSGMDHVAAQYRTSCSQGISKL